jgi:hypothetical protein
MRHSASCRKQALVQMLKKVSGFVLASLRGLTYDKEYASPLRSLRPCRKTFLSICLGKIAFTMNEMRTE